MLYEVITGTRKGLADTALRTAESGYLTRRLVDVAQDVIVVTEDCFADRGETVKGNIVRALSDGHREIESLTERIWGRYSVKDIVNPETGEVIVKSNELITKMLAEEIEDAGIKEVEIRRNNFV